MLSLPLLFAPFRALIGFKSDTHVSALGWRRVPYIWQGTLLQWGGFAIMPFALLVLSGKDYVADWPALDRTMWPAAALAFLLVGAGVHIVQTVGLALATDLAPREDQPKVVGLMYVMLLVGMIISALRLRPAAEPLFPGPADPGDPGRRRGDHGAEPDCRVEAGTARSRPRRQARGRAGVFRLTGALSSAARNALRGLIVIGLGTLGFGMADVLLEPYGGQVLQMTVSQTTKLTAVFAGGGLIGFAWASRVLSRGYDPLRMAGWGALIGRARVSRR